MKLSPTIQDSLLTLLLHDEKGGAIVRSTVPTTSYDDYYSDVARAAIKYWEKYGKPPGEHVVDIFNDLLKEKRRAKEPLAKIKKSVELLREKVNREYVLGQAALFCRWANLNQSVGAVLDIIEKDSPTEQDIQKAENLLFEAKNPAASLNDPGIMLNNPAQALRFLASEELRQFHTGVKVLDKAGIRPARRKLYTLMSDSGAGKSQHCAGIAKEAAMVDHANVLMISLEMQEDEYAERMMQTLYGFATRDQLQSYIRFERDEQGQVVGFKTKKLANVKNMRSETAYAELQEQIELTRPRIRIKGFPTGSLTVEELDAYLTSLEWQHDYIADCIIIDYPDLMFYDAANERAEIASIYRRLRGLAIKRNFALVAVTQANRSGEDAKLKTAKHTGHALEKYQISDYFITYNQTEIEKARGLARLYVSKGRNEADKFTVMISQNYGLGQFCMDSVRMPASAYNQMLQAEHVED